MQNNNDNNIVNKPVIGLTMDYRENKEYSAYPFYALRSNHIESIENMGVCCIGLMYMPDLIDQYIEMLDGIIITGGDFDIDPSIYGEEISHERVQTIPQRTQFEINLVKKALKKNLPILGICGGQQLLNVALGGSLIQHIPCELDSPIQHEQPNPRHEPGHKIEVKEGTKLSQIVKDKEFMVNSAHHQAVKTIGDEVIINAKAPDGIIEGIEHPGYDFCIGVQWHPEFLITENDTKILQSFVNACNNYALRKNKTMLKHKTN